MNSRACFAAVEASEAAVQITDKLIIRNTGQINGAKGKPWLVDKAEGWYTSEALKQGWWATEYMNS